MLTDPQPSWRFGITRKIFEAESQIEAFSLPVLPDEVTGAEGVALIDNVSENRTDKSSTMRNSGYFLFDVDSVTQTHCLIC